jgi:hypothetical protein
MSRRSAVSTLVPAIGVLALLSFPAIAQTIDYIGNTESPYLGGVEGIDYGILSDDVIKPAAPAPPPSWPRGWAPPNSYKFRHAAACQRYAHDDYVIAAVFWVLDPPYYWDVLYYIRIDGNSSSPTYGDVMHVTAIDTSLRIDNVDCADDNNQSVFIAYDKYYQNARWVKFVGDNMAGNYELSNACEVEYNHQPRIAYANSRVVVMYEGFYFPDESRSCGVCWSAYSTYGFLVHSDSWWPGGSFHREYDLAWGPESRYVVGLKYLNESQPNSCRYGTFTMNRNGVPDTDPIVLVNIYSGYCPGSNLDDPSIPSGLLMEYSPNDWNYCENFILLNDREVYWLNTGGYSEGMYAGFGGPYQEYALCEYWGNYYGIAHSYTEYDDGISQATTHRHWAYIPWYPLWTYSTNNGYFPEACSARRSHVGDTEVFLVSRMENTGGDYPAVYWNFEPQNI